MEIIKIENGVKMTSRELAELTGKEHKNVMADIRDESEKLEKDGENAELIFQLGEYKDQNNQSRPQFVFGKEGAMQIAMRYSATIRRKVILKLEELENKNSPALPQNYIEALEALIKSEKEKLEIVEENKIIKKDLEHKNEVIVDITENVPAKTMRKMINSIIRKNCKDYSARWNVLYTEFYNRYSVNLKIRAEHRLLNTLDYAEKFGYIRDLYNLTVELFETEYDSIKNKFIGIR